LPVVSSTSQPSAIKTEEAALVTEGRLNGVMREIMQSKMRGVCGLFLPSGGTVLADASKDACTAGLFRDLAV
jgi:hypothetical protein